MGLDFKDLNLSEPYLTWYSCGLRYVIRPTGLDKNHISNFPNNRQDRKCITFPEPWNSIWKRLTPPHTFLWTYWELGKDLTINYSSSRCNLFNRITNALQWPKSSIVFWPLSAYKTDTYKLELNIFWYGCKIIQPSFLVCFGQSAFRQLFPSYTLKYGIFEYEDYQIVYLPGAEDMLPDNRQIKKIVWNTLKSLSAKL